MMLDRRKQPDTNENAGQAMPAPSL